MADKYSDLTIALARAIADSSATVQERQELVRRLKSLSDAHYDSVISALDYFTPTTFAVAPKQRGKQNKYTCKTCGKKLSTAAWLARHESQAHGVFPSHGVS